MLLPREVDQTVTSINADRITDDRLAAIAFAGGLEPPKDEDDEGSFH
jgi:hypothetical protein